MGIHYAIIGAGRQGTASTYDLVQNGNADKVLLIDSNPDNAEASSELINKLTGKNICIPKYADVRELKSLRELLSDCHAMISAVPYKFNYELTELAIDMGINFCDLGGNTELVKEQLLLNERAKEKQISVVPDCGMDPGLNISLIMYMYELFDEPVSIKSYGAGLPQKPKPPYHYHILFNLEGLTNEYYGNAIYVRNGKAAKVPALTEFEDIELPEPFKKLEAAVTSGGLSTLPYTLENKIQTLENKTLRYSGHWQRFQAFSELGLFETEPVRVNNTEVIPREFYHTLIEPQITSMDLKDYGIIKIIGNGKKDNKDCKIELELIDKFDENTGFTSMQRLTGWHGSIISILSAEGKVNTGAVPVEKAVAGKTIYEEIAKRGIQITENIQYE